jgi:hypothetical protein
VRRPALALALCALGAASCGYYNGMWSADHFAAQARRQERDGRRQEARASWAAAAVKAESVVAHHPHGRWAAAALVLHGEGLAKSGACDRAAVPLARALESVKDAALRERAALAAAECDLDARNPGAAEQRLQPLGASTHRARASRAAYLSGRVAEQRGDFVAAAGAYAQSSDPEAGPARARVLLAAGRTAAALSFMDTLARGHLDEDVWAMLFAAIGDGAGVMDASRALDHALATGHVVTGSRARLLLADGNRLLAVDSLAAADARYERVAVMVPDSFEGQTARVRQLRVSAARATTLADLGAVKGRLDRLTQGGTAGAALNEARALQRVIQAVIVPGDLSEEQPFRAAELARDSLHAPQLAANLFLAFARDRPASLFAPKALVAAAALAPERRDSLVEVLHSTYGTSPYTLALRGEPSPAYAAAEDSLARALGVVLEQPSAVVGSLVSPPVPGPRGPALDPPAPERAPTRRPPGRPPVRGEDAPAQGERGRSSVPPSRPERP